jgi:SAM-dependent methyltransferase
MYDGSDADAERRLREVRQLLDDDEFAVAEPIYEAAPEVGYRAWSDSYDEPGNPIIALEQPAVWSLIEQLAPGRVLDAACGTGRHARRLVELGHDVLGIDLTREMLDRAALNVPEARFEKADLRAIPVGEGEMDLVVCGLALSHLRELQPVIDELARVLRPGGHLVASVLHPFQAHLGWHAPFADSTGGRGFVREHAHTHSEYLATFRAAGLEVEHCLEPVLTAEHVQAKRRAFRHIPEAVREAYVGLPAVLVWSTRRNLHSQRRAD